MLGGASAEMNCRDCLLHVAVVGQQAACTFSLGFGVVRFSCKVFLQVGSCRCSFIAVAAHSSAELAAWSFWGASLLSTC
jgi:hypothetical protein